jgi:hypothetical protein
VELERPRSVIWVVVNLVALLQAVGFVSRLWDRTINHRLGVVIAVLAVPATWALVEFARARAGWRLLIGPVAFDLFVLLMLAVDFIWTVEFRTPRRPAVLIPYLVLFFGSIVLMGAPMYRVDRRRWLLTALSTSLLVIGMAVAMVNGVG